MMQTSVEGYREEQHSLWRRLIQYAVLLVAGLFLAILVTAFIPGLTSTAHAADGGTAISQPSAAVVPGAGRTAISQPSAAVVPGAGGTAISQPSAAVVPGAGGTAISQPSAAVG